MGEGCHEDDKVIHSLTPNRRDVLLILRKENRPMKAYDIIKELSSDRHDVKPPTVYRALEYLVKKGLVHHIRQLQMYAACCLDGNFGLTPHHFLVCDSCGKIQETTLSMKINDSICEELADRSFTVRNTSLVFQGHCASCSLKD